MAVKVFISLSLVKSDSLDVGRHLAAAGGSTWPWGCAMEWLLWVAVGLDLGGHWVGALGVPARARVVRKSILRLKIEEFTCIKYVYVVGCGEGRKRWTFLRLQKGL